MLLRFETVGTEQLQTALSLGSVETSLRALEQLEHIVYDDGLQINLVLVVQILRAKLDLQTIEISYNSPPGLECAETNLGHVHLRV